MTGAFSIPVLYPANGNSVSREDKERIQRLQNVDVRLAIIK